LRTTRTWKTNGVATFAPERFIVVRHAAAGRKRSDPEADALRELDVRGREAAARLPDLVTAMLVPRHVISSPHLRCVETVEPLAAGVGLRVQLDDRLAPAIASPEELRRLFVLEIPANAVVCTHGEVLECLFGREVPRRKGAMHLVERRNRELTLIRYVDPTVDQCDPRREVSA
jgi:8-oxo-dGTP diphosphatase